MYSVQQLLDSILPPGFVQCVGWLLVHSLWQFTLIALAMIAAGPALRRQSAALRYWILTFALLLMALTPIATWLVLPIEPKLVSAEESTSAAKISDELVVVKEPMDGATALMIPGESTNIYFNPSQITDESSKSDLAAHSIPVQQQLVSQSKLQQRWTSLESAVGPWLSILVTLWCCGVLLLSVRLVWSWWTVRRFRRRAAEPVADFVTKALHRMSATLRVARPVQVMASTLVAAPIVVGCFRSVILLPASFISSVPVSQLEAILAHELAHVRRYDYLINLLQTLIETLYFYHPAVWWLSHRIRVERENCCDDLVVGALDNRVEYGRALLAVEEFRGQIRSSLALSARDGSLVARIRRLLADPIQDDQRSSGGVAALAMLATGLAILFLWYSTSVLGQSNVGQIESAQDEPAQNEVASQNLEEPSQSDAEKFPTALRFHGRVVDEAGGAVIGATVHARTFDDLVMKDTTDDQGSFSFFVEPDNRSLTVRIMDQEDERMWVGTVYFNSGRKDMKIPGLDEPLVVKLVPVIQSLVSVIDADGKPVVGATVVVQDVVSEVDVLETDAQGHVIVRLPESAQPMIMAFKSGAGYDYFSADVRDENNYPVKNPPKLPSELTLKLDGAQTVCLRAVTSTGQPVAGVTIRPWYVRREGNPGDTNFVSSAFSRETDATGLAIFDWLPHDVKHGLTFRPNAKGYDADPLRISLKDIDDGQIREIILKSITEISGRVVDDNDQPLAGATVTAQGQGVDHERRMGTTTSEADGRFTMRVSPDKAYVIHVKHDDLIGYRAPIVVREGKPITDAEIRLKRGTVIRGRATRGTPPRPLAGQGISLRLELDPIPDEIEALRPEGNNFYFPVSHSESTTTDEEGNFQFLAARGEYFLSGPRQAKQHRFIVTDERELEWNFEIPREEMMEFVGSVFGPEGQPLRGVGITGVYKGSTHSRHFFHGQTVDDGRFSIQRETQPAVVQFLSADKSLGAIVSVDADLAELNVTLQPTCAATGQLLTPDGQPIVGVNVRFSVKVYRDKDRGEWVWSFGGSAITDDDGHYQLEHLIQNVQYDVYLQHANRFPRIAEVFATSTDTIDLGVKRLSMLDSPKPLGDRVVEFYRNTTPLADRLARLKQESARDFTRIAVIVADPESIQARWFYKLLRASGIEQEGLNVADEQVQSIRKGMNEFRQLWVDARQLSELQESIPNHQLKDLQNSALILLDADGSWLSSFELEQDVDSATAANEILAAINAHQLPKLDAAEILANAKAQAAIEGKRILLQETATWCGPCHRLSRFIEQHRQIFDRHFVWIKIDRERMKNANGIMQNIRPGNWRSLPWLAVLNSEGDCLVRSSTGPEDVRPTLENMIRRLNSSSKVYGPQRQQVKALVQKLEERRSELNSETYADDNYGFPSEPEEVEHFLTMLQTAAEALSEDDIDTLRDSLLPIANPRPKQPLQFDEAPQIEGSSEEAETSEALNTKTDN